MSKLISKLASTSEKSKWNCTFMEKTVSLYLLKIQWLVSLFATKGMVYLLTVDCISAGFQQLIKRALKFKNFT